MMPRRKPLPQRDYARRGVYVDYLNRWMWSVDSLGGKSPYRMIATDDDAAAVQDDLSRDLDQNDPIPADAFVPAPIRRQLSLL
jgi:hypothetical protein